MDTFSLLRRWQDYLAVSGRCNATTRRQYRRYVFAFLADTLADPANLHLGGIRDITEDDVIAYVAAQDARGGMRRQTLKGLHSFYAWAERRREITDNPVSALPLPREKYTKAPTLEADERELLFAAAEAIDPRAQATMELMYATGARIGSLCGVMPQDIYTAKSGRRWIHFAVAKGDRPYDVPLNVLGVTAVDRLLELLAFYPAHAPGRAPTLVGVGPETVWEWVHRAAEASEIQAWPHLFRHSFAADLEDVDDRTWAALMNHRDASLRRRYAAPKNDRMEAGVDRVGVRGLEAGLGAST